MSIDQRKQFLSNQETDFLKANPKLISLRDKLISLGGDFVLLGFEEDLEKILSRGKKFNGRGSKLMIGQASRCHQNSAELWDRNKERLQLVTGWALSTDEDGIRLWRQHSWLFDNKTNKVIETTCRRDIYYGFVLNFIESQQFYYDNL